MLCYRIKNWRSGFETADSLKYKQFAKVLVSNLTSSPEYKRIMRLPNKDSIIAGWLAIIQTASDMPERGILCRRNGPLDVSDVAEWMLQTPDTIEAALIAITDPRIGWIEVIQCPRTLKRSGTGVRMLKDPQTGEKKLQAVETLQVDIPAYEKRFPYNKNLVLTANQALILDVFPNEVRDIPNEVRDISNAVRDIPAKISKDKLSKGKVSKDNIISAPEGAVKNNSSDYYLTKQSRILDGDKLDRFLSFWKAFDFKKHKTEAADEWLDLNGTTENAFDAIISAAKQEAKGRTDLIKTNQNPREAPNWLKARSWEDEFYTTGTTAAVVLNDWPEGARQLMRDHWDAYQNFPKKAEELLQSPWVNFQHKPNYYQLKKLHADNPE